MIGLLFGSVILGILSDNYGRKIALLTSVVFLSCSGNLAVLPKPIHIQNSMLFSGFIGAFVPQGPVYAFFRFLTGTSECNTFLVRALNHLMELS